MGVRTTIFIFAMLIVAILLISLYLTNDKFRQLIPLSTSKIGRFSLANAPPSVDIIFINRTGSAPYTYAVCSEADPLNCFVQGINNRSITFRIKAKITDPNGNCNTFNSNNGTAYLCNGTVTTCTPTNADHTISMNFVPGEQWGPGGIYCNMTGSTPVWFYEVNGTWRVNITVTDGLNRSSNTSRWTYGEIWAFTYPAEDNTYIDMGTLNVGQWNNGTGGQLMQNSGNIVLDLLWNATNFTGLNQGETFNKSGNNYRIDDDTLSPSDTGSVPEANIPVNDNTRVEFNSETGLLRCSIPACSNVNATFNAYWHLELPLGLLYDEYRNTIEINGTWHT